MSRELLKLRPVSFRYKPEYDDGAGHRQYGLIAEEVASIFPELAVLDNHGAPMAVRYELLPPILLNEVQRQNGQLLEQAARLDAQQREIEELRRQVHALVDSKATAAS